MVSYYKPVDMSEAERVFELSGLEKAVNEAKKLYPDALFGCLDSQEQAIKYLNRWLAFEKGESPCAWIIYFDKHEDNPNELALYFHPEYMYSKCGDPYLENPDACSFLFE